MLDISGFVFFLISFLAIPSQKPKADIVFLRNDFLKLRVILQGCAYCTVVRKDKDLVMSSSLWCYVSIASASVMGAMASMFHFATATFDVFTSLLPIPFFT